MFRPVEMMWVDLLVERGSVNECLEQLGRLRVIELQRYDRSKAPFEVIADRDSLRRLLALEHELERAVDYLPGEDAGGLEDSCWGLPTESVLPGLEQRCRDWLTRARPLGRRLREIRTRIEQLELLALALRALPPGEIAVDLLRGEDGQSYPPFVALGSAAELQSLDVPAGESIVHTYPLPDDAAGSEDGQRMLVVGVTGAAAVKDIEQGFLGCVHVLLIDQVRAGFLGNGGLDVSINVLDPEYFVAVRVFNAVLLIAFSVDSANVQQDLPQSFPHFIKLLV